jgi:hypothetical protein
VGALRRFPLSLALALALPATPALASWLQRPEGGPWPSRVSVTPTGAGPVVADVSALAARSFALTDAAGTEAVFSVTDTDANGTGDELTFVARAGEACLLYFSPEPGPTASDANGVQIRETRAGSWVPLHLPPVNARGAGETLAAARAANAGTAAQVLEGLGAEGPMIAVTTAAWEVWIGGHSGLIERLRPRGQTWAGSALREWAANLPNSPGSGETRVEARSAERVVLRHRGGVVRDLEVWADGTILTTGDTALQEPQLLVGALPFEALRESAGGDEVRFGDVSDTGREADTDILGWTAPGGAALTCQLTGARFGPVAAQTQGDDVLALLSLRAGEGFSEAAGRLTRALIPAALWECGLAGLAGGEAVRVDYFPQDLSQAPGGRFGVQQARLGLIQGPPKGGEPRAPEAPARATVEVRRLGGPVVCLQPGRGLSPGLEPYPLAPENPPAAWSEVTVHAPEGVERVQIAVEAAPWLEGVETASPGAPLTPTALRRGADRYATSAPVVAGRATYLLGLKAAEGELGTLTATLRVSAPGLAALAGLRVEVEPGIPLFVLGPASAAAGRSLPTLGPAGVTDASRPRRRLAEAPEGLADPRVWEGDMPLLAVTDEAAARALGAQWEGARDLRAPAGAAGSDRLLVASLLPADGPGSSYASLRRLAWVCWSLGLTEGGLGWRAGEPLVWETEAGPLPTDRLLALRDSVEDVRRLAWAQARQAPQGEAIQAALAGRFSAARAALGETAK